ncbi:MAG: hypothetical protein RLZZ28_662 [Bacteroidota bacterium]|jgi:6-pyruvoyltetrahydropterin/6-carboxytetrahydropterin synthase
MLQVTKIFRFETAHAIHGYNGHCKNIHGHSYVLHVTVAMAGHNSGFIESPGFIIDFKDLKQYVNEKVISRFDHQLILSEAFIKANPTVAESENIHIWKVEPTAENILLHIRNELQQVFPPEVVLHKLTIFETSDSYAVWEKDS